MSLIEHLKQCWPVEVSFLVGVVAIGTAITGKILYCDSERATRQIVEYGLPKDCKRPIRLIYENRDGNVVNHIYDCERANQ